MTPQEAQRHLLSVFNFIEDRTDADTGFVALRRLFIDLAIEYAEEGCALEAVDQAILALEKDARIALNMVRAEI